MRNATQFVAVHHDYSSQQAAECIRVELGDLYAREPKPLLAEFLVTGAVTTDTLVTQLVVTGDVLTANGGVEHHEITLPVMLSPTEGAHVEPELRRELLLLEAARARRDALKRRCDGDFDGAAATLRQASHSLREASPGDEELVREAEELGDLAASFVAMNVSEADAKYMYHRAYNASSGRRKKDELIRRMKRKDEERPTP